MRKHPTHCGYRNKSNFKMSRVKLDPTVGRGCVFFNGVQGRVYRSVTMKEQLSNLRGGYHGLPLLSLPDRSL